jgi:hypothetical protein
MAAVITDRLESRPSGEFMVEEHLRPSWVKNGGYLGQCPCLPAGQLDPDERTRDDVGAKQRWELPRLVSGAPRLFLFLDVGFQIRNTTRAIVQCADRQPRDRSPSPWASLEQKPCHFSHVKMAEDREGEAPRSSAKFTVQDERKIVELRRSLEPQCNDALRRDLAEVTSAANEGLQRCLWWTRIRATALRPFAPIRVAWHACLPVAVRGS